MSLYVRSRLNSPHCQKEETSGSRVGAKRRSSNFLYAVILEVEATNHCAVWTTLLGWDTLQYAHQEVNAPFVLFCSVLFSSVVRAVTFSSSNQNHSGRLPAELEGQKCLQPPFKSCFRTRRQDMIEWNCSSVKGTQVTEQCTRSKSRRPHQKNDRKSCVEGGEAIQRAGRSTGGGWGQLWGQTSPRLSSRRSSDAKSQRWNI